MNKLFIGWESALIVLSLIIGLYILLLIKLREPKKETKNEEDSL